MKKEIVEKITSCQNNREELLSACEAALVHAEKNYQEAIAALNILIQFRDSTVKQRVAQILAQIGGELSVYLLLDLVDDPHPEVRKEALHSIGRLRAHTCKEKLMEIMEEDSNLEVRITAAAVLGKLGIRDGLGLIRKALEIGNTNEKRLAIHALYDIINQRFSSTPEGIKSAKRYLDVNLAWLIKEK